MTITTILVFLPLITSIVGGFFRNQLGKCGVHTLTISGVTISFILSLIVTYLYATSGNDAVISVLYHWLDGNQIFNFDFNVGFMIDGLTCCMLMVVTFISLLVHIYSIGYMADDDGYQRFFSYISLFTFMMLMLITANNFLQLFFGWEGVGLVSYLLIGFWYKKESAISGNLKAFLVNRVGDFGFILGIGMILTYAGSLDFQSAFNIAPSLANKTISLFSGYEWNVLSVTCILLFIGAMGKSAQVPLHVWLPESMEGPTPISALIHAATMVTAGVFMVARLSPIFEYSQTALSFILVIGATGALFTGLLGLVMNDIKRVVAYSTLSQLGYMMVAMGLSAYSAGIFHLATHACFKALLFLGAGSVIIGMHHEQDMRKMGGLRRKMPITYWTCLVGSLALCAFPFTAGFYSKDTIIELAKLSTVPGATYAYYCVMIGAMVTAMYTFRAFFMTFHGQPRMDKKTWSHVHESPAVVWIPLVVLAIPSLILGYILYMPMLFTPETLLGKSIFVLPAHNALTLLSEEVKGPFAQAILAPTTLTFWLTITGTFIAWLMYCAVPRLPQMLSSRVKLIYWVLANKYGFDALNEKIIVPLFKNLGNGFYLIGDKKLIDGFIVNGSSKVVVLTSKVAKQLQTGYMFHYITLMVLGVFGFLCWMILG